MVGQFRDPQRPQASFLASDGSFESLARFSSEFEFLADRRNEMIHVYSFVRGEVPQVVEITGFVSGWVCESYRFLGGNFSERIDKQGAILRKIGEFFVSPQNWAILEWKYEAFVDGDIDFDVILPGQGARVPEIEGMAVRVARGSSRSKTKRMPDCSWRAA